MKLAALLLALLIPRQVFGACETILATDSSKVADTGDAMTGSLTMSNAPISLTGSGGYISGGSSITTAGSFFGPLVGNVTGSCSGNVLKAGDTVTGALTMSGASSFITSGSSITTAGAFFGPLVGNAATSSALAANGTNCSAGQYARGVDASGNAENCTAASTPSVSTNSYTLPTKGSTFTNTVPNCEIAGSTITVTMTGGQLLCGFSGHMKHSDADGQFFAGYFINGQFANAQDANTLVTSSQDDGAGDRQNLSFIDLSTGTYSGAINVCFAKMTNTGTATFCDTNGARGSSCRFWCKEWF